MIGSHLFQILRRRGQTVIGSYYRPTIDLEEIAGDGELVELNVRYFEPVRRLVEDRRPGAIFHLAARSLPTLSGQRPWETIDVYVTGTVQSDQSGPDTRCKLRSCCGGGLLLGAVRREPEARERADLGGDGDAAA